MGFSQTRSDLELNLSPPDYDHLDFVSLVPHLVPEARVVNFDLFNDDSASADGTISASEEKFHDTDPPAVGLDLEENIENDTEILEERRNQDIKATSKRYCSAQSLEKEAYILLDEAKEYEPARQQVR